MNCILLAFKDLKRVVSDRRAFAVSLLLPLLLTFIMGLSFGGGLFGKSSGISAIPVAMVADNLPTLFKDRLAEGMTESGYFTVTWADSAGADALVRQGEVAAAVVVPETFLDDFLDRQPVHISLWKDPGSQLKAEIVEQILGRAMARYQAGEAAYRTLWPDTTWRIDEESGETWPDDLFEGDFSDIWQRFRSPEGSGRWAEARDHFLTAMDRQAALVQVMDRGGISLSVQDKAPGGEFSKPRDINLFNYFLPSFSVFFLMFAVAASCRDLHRERRAGTLQRQLLSPVTSVDFLLGKWLAAAGQGLIMLAVLFLLGGVLYRVNLGPDFYSLAVVSLLCSTAAASVFLFLGLISPTEKFMDNLTTVVILVTAMLGGNMIPLDSMPAWMARFGQFGFNYWANLSFQNIMVENLGLAGVLQPAAVLLGVSVVLLGASLFIFVARTRRGGLS